jgi:hypothetical protein
MLWSPTIRAALLAGTPWLDMFCPGCGTSQAIDLRTIAQAFRTRIGLCRHSNRSLFAGANSAGKKFGEARDWAAFFGDASRFLATETVLSRVSGSKAAERQRLFRRRQEAGIAEDRVVAEPVPFGPVSASIFPANREKNREFGENRPSQSMLKRFFKHRSNDLQANSLQG